MAKATQRTIPNSSAYGVVNFSIRSDGKEVEPVYEIVSINTLREVNRIPSVKLVIRDGSASDETFEVSESDDFAPGKEIEIRAGYDDSTETLFKGIVIKHSVKIRDTQSLLIIEAKDLSVKMTVGRHCKYYEEKKDSEILKEILSSYGLAGKIAETQLKHKEVVQHNVTDWDFILSRAEMNGLLVIATDGKVDLQEPKVEGSAGLELLYGSTLLEFEAEMDARTQYKEITARSWSYKEQKIVEQKGKTSFTEHGNISGDDLSKVIGLPSFELSHGGQVLNEELKAWASAGMLRSRMSKTRGRAKFKGFPGIKPGDTVLLDGLGKRFNGNAFVSAVSHSFVNGNWVTDLQFGVSPEWFARKAGIQDLPAAGLLPAIQGVQIGKVVQLKEDPDGEDRILVKLPIIDPNAKGVWARRCTLDAGKERGSFFLPEIDDEVIVGFINDDPRDAVVLGMVHSSPKKAPFTATDENHEKGFVTRSKMRIWFDDDKKIMTLDTPAGNLIEMSEEGKSITIKDQNDNKIILNEKGIEISSPKDIRILAKGMIEEKADKDFNMETQKNMSQKAASNATLEAKQKINIKATSDCGVEGLNVAVKAKVKLDAEGSAQANLKGGAMTTVKGGLVQIN